MTSSLYRTHRPLHFRDVLGQPQATSTLLGALRKDRVGHAYLLTGPRGTGKTSSARIFARAACCLNLVEGEPDDTCVNCRALLDGNAYDFSEIDAASNRGIEDVRSLRESAAYPPVQLPYRVFVIDEVHMLTVEAFNALLKLLEEPPKHCLFLLATTELQKVPLTIRSRCQTINFRPAPVETIVEKLKMIAKAEKISIDPRSLELLAAHAEGGFRDAETLLEQLVSAHEKLTTELVLESLGIVPEAQLSTLLEALLAADPEKVRMALRDIPETRSGVIRQLLELTRAMLYSPGADLMKLQRVFERILEAYILQKSAPLPRIALEVACFSLCLTSAPTPGMKPVPHVAPAAPIPIPKKELPATVPIVANVELEAQPELPSEKLNDIRKAWKTMIDKICRENSILGGTLKQGTFHTASSGRITVHVKYKFHADKFNEKKNRDRILELLHELTGEVWDVHYIVNADLPKRQSQAKIGTGVDDAVAVFGEVS